MRYPHDDLDYPSDLQYYTMGGHAGRWEYSSLGKGYPSEVESLRLAMAKDPYLHVMGAVGEAAEGGHRPVHRIHGALRAAWLDEVTNKGSVAMDVSPHVRYRIDRDDRIAEVNDAWPKFATENEAEGLEPSRILSRSIWGFLADDTTIQLYKSMIGQLREGGLPMRFRFRCDAPDRRRLLAMEITSNLEGDVMFNVRSAAEQSRPYVSLLGHADVHSGDFLVMCAWCKRIPISTDRWVEAEEAVNALGLFLGSPLPTLTHGTCPSCFNAMEQLLEDRELAAAGTVTCGALLLT